MVHGSGGRTYWNFPYKLCGTLIFGSSRIIRGVNVNLIMLQEALPDLSTAELQKEAQEEARVFAAQGP
jgi:hypothetical protein